MEKEKKKKVMFKIKRCWYSKQPQDAFISNFQQRMQKTFHNNYSAAMRIQYCNKYCNKNVSSVITTAKQRNIGMSI